MNSNWNEKTKVDKIIFTLRLIASIVVMICAVLQLSKVWGNANYLAVPLLSVVILTQSIQDYKNKNKFSAIVGYCCFVAMIAMILGTVL